MPDLDESSFLGVREEWKALLDDEKEQEQVAWKAAFSPMKDEDDSLRSQGKWLSGPTRFLSVIRCSRKELTHSTLIVCCSIHPESTARSQIPRTSA